MTWGKTTRILASAVLTAGLTMTAPVRADAEPADVTGDDPPSTVEGSVLDAAIDCPHVFAHLDTDPVLLVHGTAVTAEEHWGWNYAQDLPRTGRDVCTVELPDRMLGDIQVSAEYIANAIGVLHRDHAAAGRAGAVDPERFVPNDVDLIGHSQGALAPRWVLVFFPETRALVDDAVLLAGPHHGTGITDVMCSSGSCQPAVWQMRTTAAFIEALNARPEIPDGVDALSIYSSTDELVQPYTTAELDGAVNVLLQDHCPGKAVHHAGLNSDPVTWKLVVDALTHDDRPADPGIVEPADCLATTYPGMTLADYVGGNVLLYGNGGQGVADAPSVDAEPEVRPYAR